ncbi:neprilysin-2 isoform X2 [Leptinotarsa decemlineata]|uniref:neprilysin-2 isoform X2 n=1 Tax=Leptinotarsa decemlineata TaxID=7539 RepID=UPI003D3068BC
MLYYVVFLCVGFVNAAFSIQILPVDQRAGKDANNNNTSQCDTSICKMAAAKILSAMDHSVDPCENFSQYVCGNHEFDIQFHHKKNFELFHRYMEQHINRHSKKSLKDFQQFYESCVDFDPSFNYTENIKFIKKYTSTNLTGVFTELILTKSMPFFDIGLKIGEDESYVFQITGPEKNFLKTELKDWTVFQRVESECEHHLETSVNDKILDLNNFYESFGNCTDNLMMKYVIEYQENMHFVFYDDSNKHILGELLELLKNFKSDDFRNTEDVTRISISEIDKVFEIIEWKTFFEELTSKTLSGNETIEVHNFEYLKRVFVHLKNYDERGLVELLQEFSSFQLYTYLYRKHDSKKHFCMDLSKNLLPDVATMIMNEIKNSSSTNITIVYAEQVFDEMKNSINHILDESLIDEDLKRFFKLELIKLELAMTLSGNNNTKEDNDLGVVITGDYRNNVLTLFKNYRRKLFSLGNTGIPLNTSWDYFLRPFSSLSKPFYASNFVVMHPSLFDRIPLVQPHFIVVAKLGMLLAREILKHIDRANRLFRSNDNKFESDTQSNIFYPKNTLNIDELYNNFYSKSPYRFHETAIDVEILNVTIFTNEMIADITAFWMVTDYFQRITTPENMPWISSDITQEQVFIIAAAQEFCGRYSGAEFIRDLRQGRRLPFPIKIENMMSNSEYFKMVFKCSEKSKAEDIYGDYTFDYGTLISN